MKARMWHFGGGVKLLLFLDVDYSNTFFIVTYDGCCAFCGVVDLLGLQASGDYREGWEARATQNDGINFCNCHLIRTRRVSVSESETGVFLLPVFFLRKFDGSHAVRQHLPQ
ncbi:hypothetical protein TcG_06645 [Trypanosoma cruzi]|nr:hypothetical protein TcG_06645 [Trypanosoma cruzi]